MKQILKGLLLAASLLIGGQSVCSDSTKIGWNFSSFKFPSLSMPAWPTMPSLSFFRSSSSILPVLSPSQKDTAKKWALPVTGVVTIGAVWAFMKRSAQRQNRTKVKKEISQKLAVQEQTHMTPVSQQQSNYCQEIGCWQTANCILHGPSKNPQYISYKEFSEAVAERVALQPQLDKIISATRGLSEIKYWGYSEANYIKAIDIVKRGSALNDLIRHKGIPTSTTATYHQLINNADYRTKKKAVRTTN